MIRITDTKPDAQVQAAEYLRLLGYPREWELTDRALALSEWAREWYAENGSFGLTNDMIRVAEDVLNWRLQSVAFLMLLVSLAVLPTAFGLWRISSRIRAESRL